MILDLFDFRQKLVTHKWQVLGSLMYSLLTCAEIYLVGIPDRQQYHMQSHTGSFADTMFGNCFYVT